LLICFSLGHLLRLDEIPPLPTLRVSYERLLVADWTGKRLAFPVDEVRGIHRYEQRELKEVPATLAKASLSYTQSILHCEGTAVGLLDPDVLFTSLSRSVS
jgi:chemotaxis-related protein WspD